MGRRGRAPRARRRLYVRLRDDPAVVALEDEPAHVGVLLGELRADRLRLLARRVLGAESGHALMLRARRGPVALGQALVAVAEEKPDDRAPEPGRPRDDRHGAAEFEREAVGDSAAVAVRLDDPLVLPGAHRAHGRVLEEAPARLELRDPEG